MRSASRFLVWAALRVHFLLLFALRFGIHPTSGRRQRRLTLQSITRKRPSSLVAEIVGRFPIELGRTDGTPPGRAFSYEEPTPMDVRAILHELTRTEGLPREALKAASAQRVEMVPVFLKEIENYLALEPAARAKPNPLFYVFHLLGEWRETSAYIPLARFLRCPREEIDTILGDAIASTSHRVMASVFDGDPQPLHDIILDPNAEQFIRSRMCEALAMVTLRGDLDRTLTGRFLRDAFIEMQPQAQCYVWVGWQSAIAMLGISDLKSLAKKAFVRGLVDSHVLGFDHFEQDLRRAIEHPGGPWRLKDHEYTLFGDTIDELSDWYCFTEQYSEDREQWRRQAEASARNQRLENPFKNVGGNDPCPCGRGKKFKKCGLH